MCIIGKNAARLVDVDIERPKISWYANRLGMVRREWHTDGIGYTDSDLISFRDAANLLEKYDNENDRLTEEQ